jgi:hypothetical protein
VSSSEQPQRGPAASARTATASRPAQDAAAGRPTTASGRPGTPAKTTERPATAKGAAAAADAPRRVRLTVSRVDPWSVLKLSFLLSVALGIALVVAAAVLWSVLDGMGVFSDVNRVVGEILGDQSFDVMSVVGLSKVLSLATVFAVVDVVLVTAIATLGAFLYNLASTLVGGLQVTLSDD